MKSIKHFFFLALLITACSSHTVYALDEIDQIKVNSIFHCDEGYTPINAIGIRRNLFHILEHFKKYNIFMNAQWDNSKGGSGLVQELKNILLEALGPNSVCIRTFNELPVSWGKSRGAQNDDYCKDQNFIYHHFGNVASLYLRSVSGDADPLLILLDEEGNNFGLLNDSYRDKGTMTKNARIEQILPYGSYRVIATTHDKGTSGGAVLSVAEVAGKLEYAIPVNGDCLHITSWKANNLGLPPTTD